MPVSSNPDTEKIEVTVSFSAHELELLEAVASQLDLYVPEFIHRVAIEAANINRTFTTDEVKGIEVSEPSKYSPLAVDTALDTEQVEARKEPSDAIENAEKGTRTTAVAKRGENGPAKHGSVGERSTLAKGHGPVWEIRQALGRERLHGLGWTREHLAFVLKMSVVGVRKLEKEGKIPVKSREAREQLLKLARALQEPTEEIRSYIQDEEAALN